MPFARTGRIVCRVVESDGLCVLSFDWKCDADGIACDQVEWPMGTPFSFDGMLVRYVARSMESGLVGTYSVTLRDEADADSLNGQCGSLTLSNTTADGDTLSRLIGTDGRRPLSVAGPHWLYVDAEANTWGTFDLYYVKDEVDLQRAGVH